MQIKITVLDAELKRWVQGFNPRTISTIQTRSINAGISAVRKECVHSIAEHYDLKKRDINGNVIAKRVRNVVQTGKVVVRASPIGLDKFKLKQNRFGVMGTVDKTSGSSLLKSAFITNIKGKRMVMVRTKRIDQSTKRYVVKPSSMPPHRSTKGADLPINRLLADPTAGVIAPQATRIEDVGSKAVTNKMLELAHKAMDAGRV